MSYERAYTKEDLAIDIFLPKTAKDMVETALNSGKPVTIVHSSFKDECSDYSEVVIDGKVVHHQKGY